MKIVFCWSDISGYMAACWRELAARDGVELHVFAYGNSQQTAFGLDLMEGVPWTPLDNAQRTDAGFLGQAVAELQPDVVVIAGWLNPGYVALTHDPRFGRVKFIMGMDTPWRDTLRQKLARYVLRRYLARLSAIFVPGERAWQFARRLGFPGNRIHRGMYGVDWEGFGHAFEGRLRNPWPRVFLFAGRYEAMKGVDILIDAYRVYRKRSTEPWELHVCGMGGLAARFEGEPGITDHGFCQPEDIRRFMAGSGALILPSRYDPWPLIVVEGAAAGLPLLVSEACGSTVEVLRPMFNGLTISPNASARELADAMMRLAAQSDLEVWSRRSRMLAQPYAVSFWADRWLAVMRNLEEESTN